MYRDSMNQYDVLDVPKRRARYLAILQEYARRAGAPIPEDADLQTPFDTLRPDREIVIRRLADREFHREMKVGMDTTYVFIFVVILAIAGAGIGLAFLFR